MRSEIHSATKVVHAIGHNEVPGPNRQVVASNLIKRRLAQRNIRCLALGNEDGLCKAIVHYYVRPALMPVELECHLYGNQRTGYSFIVNQVPNKVLSYPFLWRKPDVLAAQSVINHRPAILLLYGEVVGRKI